MPLVFELKRDVPFILNGAMLKLPPKASAGANRLGIVDGAELVRRGQTTNLVAGKRPLWVDLESEHMFTINRADARLQGVRLTVFNHSHLVTRAQMTAGLPPNSAAGRLFGAVLGLALLPQAGPLASADDRTRRHSAYQDAVAYYLHRKGGSPFLQEVVGLVRDKKLHEALLRFRMVIPGKRAKGRSARLQPPAASF